MIERAKNSNEPDEREGKKEEKAENEIDRSRGTSFAKDETKEERREH